MRARNPHSRAVAGEMGRTYFAQFFEQPKSFYLSADLSYQVCPYNRHSKNAQGQDPLQGSQQAKAVQCRWVDPVHNIFMQHIIVGLLLLAVMAPVSSLISVGPIEVSPNTENSPSVYLISFKLSRSLPSSGYLLFTFPNYASATLPTSCKMVNTSINLQCTNFLSPSLLGLTITAAALGSVNPNINATVTVLIDSDTALTANTNYYLQIVLSNVIPSTAEISDSFEMYSVSWNGIIYEQNWNFGQIEYQSRQTNNLGISMLSSLSAVLPGSTSVFQVDITIGMNVITSLSRLKIVLADPFTFRVSSITTTQNDPLYAATNGNSLYIAPIILNTVILTPNVIITTFNESLIAGRKFILTITDIQSPFTRSSSTFSVYSLPFNSINPYESSELSLPIQTTYFPIAVTVGLPQSMPYGDPIQFYLNVKQYMVVRLVTTQDIPAGYSIFLSVPAVTILAGTAYANTSTTTTSQAIYNYTSTTLLVSGFGLIPSGSTISISFKATINSASVQVFSSIDLSSQTFPLLNPLYYGSSAIVTAVTSYDGFMTSLVGSSGDTNSWNLDNMGAADSFIRFTIYATDSSTGSYLNIYTSAMVTTSSSFSSSTSCVLTGGVSATPFCAVNFNPNYINFQINSSSSGNYFPINTAVTVTISNLKFSAASSHNNYMYPLFFKFIRSQGVNVVSYSWMYTPNVIPQRSTMAGFGMSLSNQLANAGVNFPSVIRVISTSIANWGYVIQPTEVRVISIFNGYGFRSTLGVPNFNLYPCSSNMNVTCNYTKGQLSGTTTKTTPLDWDRVDIFLWGNTTYNEVLKTFHVIVPHIFTTVNWNYMETMAGKYDTVTRQYNYLYILATTGFFPTNAAYTSKTQTTTMMLELSGKAGSYPTSIICDVDPISGSYALSGASAIIISSTWSLYNNLTYLPTDFKNNNSVVTFGTDCDWPLSVYMGSNYLTFIPIVTAGTSAFSFNLYSPHLPYTYDLPYYSIFITNSAGNVDTYNEFINTNAGIFYYSVLLGLSISCVDSSLGVSNTVCYIAFINNHEIVNNGKIYVDFSGMTIATNYCYLTYTTGSVSNTSIPVTCTSSSNQTQLIVNLPGTATSNYPNLNGPSYVLQVYGVGITASSISQSITLTLRDNSGSYIIETGTRLLTTTVSNPQTISINQITYQYNNPIVKSSMFISFTLPRSLYLDETFVMIMGKDLSDSNTLVQKLNIILTDSANNTIDTIQALSSTSYKLTFTVTNPALILAGNYTLYIYGLQIPSSNTNDIFYIIYQRNFDNLYTLANTGSTTAPFPSLSNRINSLITMDSIFNSQGLEQQLNFNLTHTSTNVDSSTIWYINLPIYYSPTVWNDPTLAYCEISGVMLPCAADPNVPYQIKVSNSPRIINSGVLYTLSIFGVPCPRKRYLNNNATFANEYVFVGVAANSSSMQFEEYTEIYPNQAIMSASTTGGTYGLLKVKSVLSSSMYCFSNSYFKINAATTVAIAINNTLLVTFPQEFNNFHDIGLQAIVYYNAVQVASGLCTVVNRRVSINMTGSIPAGGAFLIEFSTLPTPRFAGTTDMNMMSIVVVSSDNTTTLGASTFKTNEAPTLTFIANARYIQFNSDNTFVLTAGTYSTPVPITSSDGLKFLSNVLVNFTASGFTFNSNPTSIYLGDQSTSFIIGADMNLMPTFYVYNVIKTETSLLPYYTVLTNNNIRIVNTPIAISIVSSINVPKGGCSLPINVVLSNPPYNDVSINFVYNNSLYSSDVFWINPETTNSELNFTSSGTSQWISFCSSSTISVASVPVTMVLGGTNYLSYSLANSLLTINIVTNVVNTAPTLVINQVNILKTVAVWNFTTNTKGFIFYSLQLGNNIPPLDVLNLKVQIKSMNLTLQSQADFLTYVYTKDRDYRVGVLSATVTGNNPITFSKLLPQKTYTLCAYFENQFGINTQAVCQTFTTQSWGVVSKAYMSFSKSLASNELNNILCFFVKEVAAKITNVVDLSGSSCSLGNSPQNYYYTYPGQSFSYETTATTVYLISNPEVTTDSSVSAFASMFDPTNQTITSLSLSHALNDFFINYIGVGYFRGTFDPITAETMGSGFTLTAFFDTPTFSNGVITINNVRVNGIGSVYFILQLQKQIFYNNITGETNITIKLDNLPTTEQIFNCHDWNGAGVVGCARAVLNTAGETVNVQFSGILGNSFYKLYYTAANEYPLRPVSDGTVQSSTINTLTFGGRAIHILLVVVLMALVAL